MKRYGLAFAVLLILAILLPQIASADFEVFFYEGSVGSFSSLAAYNTNDNFAPPGFSDFNPTGWSSTFTDSSHISAAGSILTGLAYGINFSVSLDSTGNYNGPLSFDLYAYNGVTLVDSKTAEFLGFGDPTEPSNWTFTDHPINNAVPEPATLLLLTSGLLSLVGLRGRRN